MSFRVALTSRSRATLMFGTALATSLALTGAAGAQSNNPVAGAAAAQAGPLAPPTAPAEAVTPDPATAISAPGATAAPNQPGTQGLEEIVVTAQRREQRLQDVPVAITALSAGALAANRVTNVSDINGLAPGFQSRPSAGGSGIASFSMRGITSYGVVPGSDKEISIYLDGVYISSSRASLFELPDISRLEVLRGPQGTLFGRNATAGALSITTRDPSGSFHAQQDLTYGNYNQFRTRTTIDTPTFGAFSGYVTYVHDERDGDVRNAGAGVVWDRTGPQTRAGRQSSPKRLGGRNLESVFAAVKFEPSDSFRTIFKFDYAANDFTPDAEALIAYNPNTQLIGPLLTSLFNSQPANGPYGPVIFTPDAKRPKVVNNDWAVPGRQRNSGYSLISDYTVNDSLSLKNTAAYRRSFITSASQISGAGGLVFTPQALVPYATFATVSRLGAAFGQLTPAQQAGAIGAAAQALAPSVGGRFIITDTNAQSKSEQWSDEIQANYSSDFVTLTGGAIYFHSKDRAGGARGITNTFAFRVFPADGRIPLGGQGVSYNKATSIAAYAQAEFHITPELDLVAGGRITRDKKSGNFVSGGTYVFPTGAPTDYVNGTFTGLVEAPFTYRKTKPNYSVGVNYKPSPDVLLYAKYSTGFVSGGSISDFAFSPETVKSPEAGIKADFFDRRLRTNLATYYAKYKKVQLAQSGQNFGRGELGTLIVPGYDNTSYGAELEISVLPVERLTLNGSFGYQHTKLSNILPLYLNSISAGLPGVPTDLKNTLQPTYTTNLSAQYETEPLFGDATLYARIDTTGRSKFRALPNAAFAQIPTNGSTPGNPVFGYAPAVNSPSSWVVNARVALRNIDLGMAKVEIAAWGRNLNNNRALTFPLSFNSYLVSTTFQPARTYGVDMSIKF